MPTLQQKSNPIADAENGNVTEQYDRLRKVAPKLVGAGGESQALPPDLSTFLARLADDLKSGQSVTIFKTDSTLTTVEAARILGVSRQFLVQLLEGNQIPFHLVGSHRRVYEGDLLAYKSVRDRDRRKILDELVQSELRDGLYFRVPLNPDECQ